MSIVLEGLTKRYEDQIVVNHVSLEIEKGEFFILLGSSGSGKTTILNLIAGLTPQDQGRVYIHGREVTDLPTQERRVGFVFQHYALFQHMSVGDNVDFGPSIHKVSKAERARRRDELLELVGLTGLENRMPRQLSGGQQQRVALARALALEPDVLLLDEPLGALDAKIRQELRRTLRTIQQRLGITSILVTHDQEEAFDLADRIGIMSFGRLLEVGTPFDLYHHPETEFVASFLGTANLLVVNTTDGGIRIGQQHFPLTKTNNRAALERRVQILFRPEDVNLVPQSQDLDCPELGVAEVEEVSFAGPVERLRLRLPPIPGVRPIAPPVPFGSSSILIDATRPPDEVARMELKPGDRVCLGVRRIHALANPGLSFLIVTDGSPRGQYAIDSGGPIARLANARVTLLGCGQNETQLQPHLQDARKVLGNGLAALETRVLPDAPLNSIAKTVERQPFDLIVLGFNAHEQLHFAEHLLRVGEHHLLLAPSSLPAPTKALICVASGEPGKDDILFTGRLVHHLGSSVTLMTVLRPEDENSSYIRGHAERFLASGLKSLALLGVDAQSKIRTGAAAEQIINEAQEGAYDLLVLGAPMAKSDGTYTLSGTIGHVLGALNDRAVMLVRSRSVNNRNQYIFTNRRYYE